MKIRSIRLSLALITSVATLVPLAPSASAFDQSELPLALDALNTYAPEIAGPPNDGAHDFAVGGGQHVGGTVNEGFSAHSGPLGESPQGHISATFFQPQPEMLRGDVICLQVTGNRAIMLAVQTEAGGAIPQGQQFLLEVVDNGNPIEGTPPDLIRNSFVGGFVPPPASGAAFPCGAPLLAPVPLERGNIVVRDVLP
jgi:hypothetical protein